MTFWNNTWKTRIFSLSRRIIFNTERILVLSHLGLVSNYDRNSISISCCSTKDLRSGLIKQCIHQWVSIKKGGGGLLKSWNMFFLGGFISTESWINYISIDVWFVRIGQYLAKIQLFIWGRGRGRGRGGGVKTLRKSPLKLSKWSLAMHIRPTN